MSTKAKQIRVKDETPETELPEGWSEAPLADLIVHVLGGAWGAEYDRKSNGLVPVNVIRGTEFKNWGRDKVKTAAVRCIEPSSLIKRQLLRGDLVVEISGGGPDQPVGRTLMIDKEAIDS